MINNYGFAVGGEFPFGCDSMVFICNVINEARQSGAKNTVFLEPKTSDDIIDHATLNMPFYFVFLMFVGKEIHLEICCRLKP